MSTAATTGSPAGPGKGHPIAFWFFFWGEFAERASYYGMRAILALYMTERLGIDKADGATFMALFISACYFLPLLGGWLADNYFGKYWTIVLFSVPYVFGQFIVGVENRYVVLFALALLAMGSGVIKPNISTLLGMTYDQQRPGQEQLRSDAFSWFYLAINIGALLSQLAVPWLRSEYSYQIAFLFPAGLMALALTFFALGKPFYARETIERSVVGTPGQQIPSSRTITGLPINYKVVSAEEKRAESRLRSETLRQIGGLFLMVMFFWAIFDQSASIWIYFADTYMNLRLFGVDVTADQIQAFNAFFIVTLLPLSVLFFNWMAAQGRRVRATDKMRVGFLLTGVSVGILSLAGYLAGQKQDALKLNTPEGVLILPTVDAVDGKRPGLETLDLKGVNLGPVIVRASDATWNADNKKWELTGGTVIFSNGTALALDKGHIDFARSQGVFRNDEAVAPSGTLEIHLAPGEYPQGDDKLIIRQGNVISIEKGQKVKSEPGQKAPKITLETTEWVPPAERVSAWWQVLAYFILTVAEILISVTGLELAFVAAPATMKSFVTACWLVTVALANMLLNTWVVRLYPMMGPGAYFLTLAGVMVVVFIIFIPFGARFNRAMAEQQAKEKAIEGNTGTV